MQRISPTLEGFRAAFRRPSFTLAEIVWRWAAGAAAAVLLFFGLIEYLDTLPVTNGELLFLRTRHPYLVAQAILHILRGNVARGLISLVLAALLLTIVWIVAASVGRLATVQALLDYFRRHAAHNVSAESATDPEESLRPTDAARNTPALGSLVRLNFLRAAAALAAILGFVGAAILAGFASSKQNPHPGAVIILFLPLAVLVSLAWSSLNWLLSLATLFAVRDHETAIGALDAAVTFYRDRRRAVAAVSIWTGILHLAAFVLATSVVTMPLAFVAVAPWRLVVLIVGAITLGYFAVADWIYMARLAGYICIAETPEELLRAPMPPIAPPTSPVQTEIDFNELILCDVPVET